MHVHILGAYVHICARCEVSVIKPVARTVHRWCQWQCQRWTIHDCIGSSAISKWANNLQGQNLGQHHHDQLFIYCQQFSAKLEKSQLRCCICPFTITSMLASIPQPPKYVHISVGMMYSLIIQIKAYPWSWKDFRMRQPIFNRIFLLFNPCFSLQIFIWHVLK